MESMERRTEVAGEALLERLNRNPDILARVERLLDLVENSSGDLKQADDAERRAIDELRAMGQELLVAWGQRLSEREAAGLERRGQVVHQVKKTALAQHLRRNRGL